MEHRGVYIRGLVLGLLLRSPYITDWSQPQALNHLKPLVLHHVKPLVLSSPTKAISDSVRSSRSAESRAAMAALEGLELRVLGMRMSDLGLVQTWEVGLDPKP